MLKIDCFISRIPTSQKRSFTENGTGQLLWKGTRFSERMFLLPFTLFQRELQAAAGKQSMLVTHRALPTGHPCQQAQGLHRRFPSLQQTCMQRSDFQGEDKYLLSHSPGEKASGRHPPGTVAAPADKCSLGKPHANIFPARASSPRIIS